MQQSSQILNSGLGIDRRRVPAGLCLLLCVCWLLPVSARGATSLDDYAGRLSQAAERAAQLARSVSGDAASGNDAASQRSALGNITGLLPATEDITHGGEIVHVDNSWLHQAVSSLNWDDDEARGAQLQDIAERLGALARRLREAASRAGAQGAPPAAEADERLRQILSREEFQAEVQQDSFLRAWLRKIQRAIDRLLVWLFTRNNPAGAPSAGTVRLLRYLILSATAAVALIGLAMLLRRFRWSRLRRKKEEGEEAREVLGEQLEAGATADDLLREAAEMARKGDFRLAIRRAYIALLCELEQRGKLKLHRSKTNNDYLRELSRDAEKLPPVAQMTSRYEQVWYGRGEATLEDYAEFIDRYREAASVR
jgi:hypothetical protein